MTGDQATESVLSTLARRAVGLSGADIERLVREARQVARRERRNLSWDDLERRLAIVKPPQPESLRWRVAVHEAGHAIARVVLGLGEITLVTIDTPEGGKVVSETTPFLETEERLSSVMTVHLAGRAAEEVLLGSCVAGSGGDPRSDLAAATRLALKMETAYGFGSEMPLLYLDAANYGPTLLHRRDIAERVNRRLETAYANARDIVREHRDSIQALASTLMQHNTLSGPELERVFGDLEARTSLLGEEGY